MSGALTTLLIPSEGSYFSKRNGRIIHIPKTHSAIVCQAKDCEYSLHFPNHMLDQLEAARIRHIKTAHYPQLLTGEMTIHLEFAWEDFEQRINKITAPYIRK